VYARQAPLLAYTASQGIVSEAYSALTCVATSRYPLFRIRWLDTQRTIYNSPITRQPGGPVDKPVNEIAERLNATADQVLLAWVKAKGAVAVTYGIPPPSTDSQTYIAHVFLSVFLNFQDELKETPIGRIPCGSRPW
jgi:diketogulonate reductase-like aldo/keto reductase